MVMLSQRVERRHSVELLSGGNFGCSLKDRVFDVDDFLDALRRVANGGSAPSIPRLSPCSSVHAHDPWPTGARSDGADGSPSYRASGISLSAPLLGIGVILFGIATFIARVSPWAAALLIVSIPVTILLPPRPGHSRSRSARSCSASPSPSSAGTPSRSRNRQGQKPNRRLDAIKGPNRSRDQCDHVRSRSIPR
jgi:hypothetical protein